MIKKFPIIIPARLHDTGIGAMLQPVGMTDLVLGALAVLIISMVKYQRKWSSIEGYTKGGFVLCINNRSRKSDH